MCLEAILLIRQSHFPAMRPRVTLTMHSALSMAHLEMISTLHYLGLLLLYFPVAPARAFYILVSVPDIAPSGSDMYYYSSGLDYIFWTLPFRRSNVCLSANAALHAHYGYVTSFIPHL